MTAKRPLFQKEIRAFSSAVFLLIKRRIKWYNVLEFLRRFHD